MLDLKFIRQNPDTVRRMLKDRRVDVDLDQLIDADQQWLEAQKNVEDLRQQQNAVSKEIGQLKKNRQDASSQIAEMKQVSDQIKQLNEQTQQLKQEVNRILMYLPNLPDQSVPVGADESDNPEIKSWGENPTFDFSPKPHWDLAAQHDLIDFQRAAKVSGSNFALFTGVGARLERALINFMLDLHITKHGYTEVSPPFVANRPSMTGTGQLPKFEEDMYRCNQDSDNPDSDLFLIPTAEVPVTNLLADEILDGEQLPIYYTAYTPCFRREAGSYGKDTRGLVRLHQFDKVEMVKFTTPETSYDEHESLLQDAEDVVQALGLPYRVISLCTGDLGFSAAKCYDIEVWAAGQERFLEISSCSNFEDFQARRANIRYRPEKGAKPELVHTLNASGLALPRVMIALLENNQQADGSIRLPVVLQPYMAGLKQIG
ncbi:MAG: serine--tRNA ligase [Candidatus Poribacteria bacterium]|nr:serine--tRNA ligase [Candidatus Poribacteria bacterium]MDP6998558.1 serine--tRNA ligase [Candidatus Poribacteria bacterium]